MHTSLRTDIQCFNFQSLSFEETKQKIYMSEINILWLNSRKTYQVDYLLSHKYLKLPKDIELG